MRQVIQLFIALFAGLFFTHAAHAQATLGNPQAGQSSGVTITRGVPVGGGTKIDIFAPPQTRSQGFFKPGKKVPILFYVHGGGWIKGTREKIYSLDKFATQRGWMLVSTDYRPVPRTNIDGQVSDIVRSLNWIQKNIAKYGGDPKRVVIMGHSAGSHLVALIGAKKVGGPIRCVIANDVQAYDMVAYATIRGGIDGVYLAAFGQNPANWVKWSPVTYVRQTSGLPPYMVMYSNSHRPRRAQVSIAFGKELKRRGTRVTMFNGRNYTHGSIMRTIGSSSQVTNAVAGFLKGCFR